jgi:hypothetical protein
MSFWEAFAIVIASAIILALILGLFTLLNAWMIRRENAARQAPPRIRNEGTRDQRPH